MDEDYSEDLKLIIKHEDTTWIGQRNIRTSLRKKPSYPHELWNKVAELHSSQARTNNFSRGYNNSFCISLPSGETEWVLTDCFKMEESLRKTSVHQAAVGNNSPDQTISRSLNKQDKDQRLWTMVNNFNNLTLETYIESLMLFFE
jgi:hypothetical protein